jgi:hypothetical protein
LALTRRSVNKSSLAGWAFGAGFGMVALWAVPSAVAGEIRIDGSACASAVHLVARDAPLSDVLKRLAKALDFQLSFDSDSNPLVSVDVVRPPIDLVAGLAPLENVSMAHTRDPRCPQRERIVNVWVLPSGPGSAMRVVSASQQAQQAQQEQSRKEQEGIDLFLKSHGFPPAKGGQTDSQ